MSETGTSSSKKVLWASTSPLTGPVGRNARTPRKHTRVVHAPPVRPTRCRVAAVLLVVGAGLEIGSIFPSFGSAVSRFPTFVSPGTSLDSSLGAILGQVVGVGPWLLAAVLIARGRPPQLRAGVGLASGSVALISAFTLFPLAQVVRYGTQEGGVGLWLTLAGAALGLVAVGVGWSELTHSWNWDGLVRPESGRLALAVLIGAAICVGSVPGWLVYHVDVPGTHQAERFPSAFHNPWPVITAQVIVILVVAGAVLLAVAWSGRSAGALALGLGVVLVGRVAAMVVRQLDGLTLGDVGLDSATLKQLGITRAQAHVAIDYDKWIVVEVAGVIALGLLALYLALRPTPRPSDP